MSAAASIDDRLPQNFWAKVSFDSETECWLWRGALARGYGVFSVAGRMVKTHRLSYETFVAPIPDGLTIDHLCRNKPCCNPAHLEPVPLAENIRRAFESRGFRSDKCKHGHEFTPENTLIRESDGGRECRACRARRSRETKQRERERLAAQRRGAETDELVALLVAAENLDTQSARADLILGSDWLRSNYLRRKRVGTAAAGDTSPDGAR